MIIWTGMGFLVFVFVFGCSFTANLITNSLKGEAYWNEHQWPFGASLLVAAVLSWLVGQFLAKSRAKTLFDKETKEEFVVAPNHTLFFIRMHWWGPILFAAGVVLMVKDLL